MFDFGEVVFGIFVQSKAANWAEGKLLLWPDFGEVENAEAEVFGLFGCHGLYKDVPRGVFSFLDGVEEVFCVPIGVRGGHLVGFGVGKGLDALVGFQMDLDIVECAVRLREFERVSRVSVHMTVAVWGTAVGEEVHDLVNGFLVGREVIPEHVCIFKVGLGVTLLSVNEEREF